MSELIPGEECYAIMGACFEVYRDKGCGFLESVFQECVEIELGLRGIPFRAQVPPLIVYKGRELKTRYVADFVCFDKVLAEIKAVSALADEHRAQVQNYLAATGLRLGLLVNFGRFPKVRWERFAH